MKQQSTLFQYYRIVSNFACTLIGTFIPLIVFQQTGKLYIALLYWILERISRVIFDVLLRNFVKRKPQIAILYRIFPLAIMYVFIIYLSSSNALVLGAMIEIFYGISNALKTMPQDVLHNYINQKTTTRIMGVTRSLDCAGIILAQMFGGFFMDYLNKNIVAILSLLIYLASVLPLYLYYLRNRKTKNFNKDYTTDATIYHQNSKEGLKYYHQTKKYVLLGYFVLHLLTSTMDQTINVLNLYLFASHSSYLTAGIYSSIFYLFYGVFAILIGLYCKYHAAAPIMTLACIASGITCTFLPFTKNMYVLGFFCSILGVCYAAMITIEFQQQLEKTRILGCSNDLIYDREYSGLMGQTMVNIVGMFGLGMIPCFFLMGICGVGAGVFFNINEEKSRKKIVDFIYQNDLL